MFSKLTNVVALAAFALPAMAMNSGQSDLEPMREFIKNKNANMASSSVAQPTAGREGNETDQSGYVQPISIQADVVDPEGEYPQFGNLNEEDLDRARNNALRKKPVVYVVTKAAAAAALRKLGYAPIHNQWRKDGVTYSFERACAAENIRVKGWTDFNKVIAAIGAVSAGFGIYYTADALLDVGLEHDGKEILTKFGEDDLGNVFACLIGLAVAGGLAMLMYAITSYWVKGHNQNNGILNDFIKMMTIFTFLASGCWMVGLNFMEQNAPSAGDAILGALTFNTHVDDLNTAEISAGVSMYIGSVLFGVVLVLAIMFKLEKGCFKPKQPMA